MKILVTGRGTSGSWQIRGGQLGAALGATVIPQALDVGGYDVAIIVKRPSPGLIDRLHRARVPVVWDVVDAWPQPHGNDWTRDQAMQWLRESIRAIGPAAIVASTQKMAADCESIGAQAACIPHHARPAQRRNRIQERVHVVGYQGGAGYIRQWGPIVEAECVRRGWQFEPDLMQLADADIALALRDYDGYPARAWKSNIKLANAQATGTPIICSPEAGYIEMDRGGVVYAKDRLSLSDALDALTTYRARQDVSDALVGTEPTLDIVTRKYLAWLKHLKF